MIARVIIISTLLILSILNGYGQTDNFKVLEEKSSRLVKLANQAKREGSILIALAYYEKLVELKPAESKYHFELAELYRHTKNYIRAEQEYLLVKDKVLEKHPETVFYLGTMQKSNGKYEEAQVTLFKFKKLAKLAKDLSLKKLGKAELLGCEMALNFPDTSIKYDIRHLPPTINNPHIDFSPIPLSNRILVYGSLKEDSPKYYNKDQLDTINLPTRKLYKAHKNEENRWVFDGEWEGPFNSDSTEVANGTFSFDSTKFYFTQCNENRQFKNICKLYYTSITDTGWSTPIAFNDQINLKGFSTSHPTVARDSKKGHELIYFVSDRPGGKGRTDIWYTEYHPKKKHYRNPKNAGSKINTGGTEMTPYFDEDTRTLYFSSNGRPNFGGLDVFSTVGEKSRWVPATNIGIPANSRADDLDFILNPNDRNGYIVSNRKGGQSLYNETCCDDLYEITALKFVDRVILGKLLNEGDGIGQLVDGDSELDLYIVDENGEKSLLEKTKIINGSFTLYLKPKQKYILEAKKDGYFNSFTEISTLELLKSDTVLAEIIMKVIPKDPIALESIHFEFGKTNLSEAVKQSINSGLLVMLKENPQLVLEVMSHTDSKGSNELNIKISQQRAESVVKHLTNKGINKDRITAQGYGESNPIALNTNADGTDNPEGRKLNRRSEFRVVDTLTEEELWSDVEMPTKN
ncbi:MAG: OmpA family protein [Flavobacteriales bacterium]|nr:OmpA family protein [Flavobacteriales bacterium]